MESSDHVEELLHAAIHHEVHLNKNPYLTLETIILRLYKKIEKLTHVQPFQNEKAVFFEKWHSEILQAYETLRPSLSHDEKACIERVLSKDSPHCSDLTKFATCWYKYNLTMVCKWFAVDGLVHTHPKYYVQDAFSTQFQNHNDAVRALYAYHSEPDKIKQIVEKAFLLNEGEEFELDVDPDFKRYVALYAEMVGEEEMKLVAADRKARANSLQPNKRKKPIPSQ